MQLALRALPTTTNLKLPGQMMQWLLAATLLRQLSASFAGWTAAGVASQPDLQLRQRQQ